MKPTDVLKEEHRVIELVLDCLEVMADRCDQGQRLDTGLGRQALVFFRNFADGCHHGKEEQHLFPMLEANGMPSENGPTAVMRQEHQDGRGFIAGMASALDDMDQGNGPATAEFVRHARGYIGMLREHIHKEDHCLFAMADDMLSEEAQQTLKERFNHVEEHEMEPGLHERMLGVVDKLTAHYGVNAEAVRTSHAEGGCGCQHG